MITQLTKRASAQPPSQRAAPFAHLAPEVQLRARVALNYYLARARDRHQEVRPWRYALMCATAVRQALHGNPPSYNQRLAYRSWKKRRARLRMIEEYGDPTAADPVGSRESGPQRGLTTFRLRSDWNIAPIFLDRRPA